MYLCWNGNFWQREYLVEKFAFAHSRGKTRKEQIIWLTSFFHQEMMTNFRAAWDVCLSCTSEHFLVLCPLSISPSHLLSKDTHLKKLTHCRNPLEFFFFAASPTQIATAWSSSGAKLLDGWQISWLLKSDTLWPCGDRRKGTDPLISQLGSA